MFGLIESSFVDYPGKICATLFFPGCQFRCPFCHNPSLVLSEEKLNSDYKKLLQLLKKRAHLLDGICITGGEPLIHYEHLIELISAVKEIKPFLIKLDTNGYDSKNLAQILDENIVDYIAMDIKTSLKKYPEAVNQPNLNFLNIKESAELIRNSGLDYEFRTTVVPNIVQSQDIEEIGNWLKGSKKFVLQQFSNIQPMLDNSFKTLKPYSMKKLEAYKNKLKPYFDRVEIR